MILQMAHVAWHKFVFNHRQFDLFYYVKRKKAEKS